MSSEKMYICKKGWVRHSKGTIINDWEFKRINPESRNEYFEEYIAPVKEVPVEVVENEDVPLAKELEKELKDRGISSKFKHTGKGLDATFTFDKPE